MAPFFQKIDMGGQATNLGVQLLQLLGVGGLGIDKAVALLKDSRQPFDGLIAPGTQHVRMHLVLGSQLADRLSGTKPSQSHKKCNYSSAPFLCGATKETERTDNGTIPSSVLPIVVDGVFL
jgi:hypothetical protein